MKTLIQLLVFTSLLGFYTVPANAIVIGSGVSIPQLNPSNVGSIFTVVNGVISQNFTISGDLEIYNLDNTTFNGIEISGAANLTFTSTTGLLFSSCNIHNCGSISLDYSEVTFTGSSVHDCTEIEVPSHSRIDANSASSFEDFTNAFFVVDRGVFNAFNTTFDNCPVSASGEMTVILQECILLNNPPTAVYLSGGGYYYGSKNIFHDNENGITANITDAEDFTHIEEHDSDFHDNSSYPVYLVNASEIKLTGNEINPEQSLGAGIWINGGNGITEISDNIITGSNDVRFGIYMVSREQASIVNNTITGIGASWHNDSKGMMLLAINNLTVEDNDVYDNTHTSGLNISGCPGVQVVSNNLSEGYDNIALLVSDDANLEANICSYAENSSFLLRVSQGVTLCSNLCNRDQDGITAESTLMMLEMNDNAMTYCGRGLVYKQDVLTNAQIEKGNYFLLNTLGAEYEDVMDAGAINAMRYVVRNLATEYPSFTPSGWFLPTGDEALDCTPIGPTPPIGIKPDVDRLIEAMNDVTPDGKATNDFMIALELIAAEPDFLLDVDIYDFYDTYSGTDLDLLPTIKNIVDLRESFPESTPVIDFDDEGVLETDLSAHFEYLEDMGENYAEVVDAQKVAVFDAIDVVDNLSPANVYEENYQFAILQYLELLGGGELNPADTSDIVDLAEGCVADDGPGIYVAQIVSDIAGLYYDKATSCTPVTPRSEKGLNDSEISNNINVFPNPASNVLQLSILLKDESINIYDIVGRLNLYQDNISGDRIDISTLEPGHYFLQIPGRNAKIPFVKS